MNFSALTQAVLAHQMPFSSTTQVQQWINDGLAYMARHADWPTYQRVSTLTTSAAQPTQQPYALTLPTDFVEMYELVDLGNQMPLHYYSFRDLSAFGNAPPGATGLALDSLPSLGRPFQYALYDGNIWLWPWPDAAYNLGCYYKSSPALLVQPTDTPEIPAAYHHLLVTYAVCYAWRANEDGPEAERWWQMFMREFNDAKWDVQNTDDQTLQIVGSMYWM